MSHKEKKKGKEIPWFLAFCKAADSSDTSGNRRAGVLLFGGYASQVSAMHEEAVRFVKESTKDTFRAEQTSQVYDVNGTRIMSLRGTKDVSYLTSDEIPEEVKEAMVSIEDKKFYSHGGIDFKAIIRAVWAMVRNGEVTQGGSTITQQLARTIFLNNDRTWQRKWKKFSLPQSWKRNIPRMKS